MRQFFLDLLRRFWEHFFDLLEGRFLPPWIIFPTACSVLSFCIWQFANDWEDSNSLDSNITRMTLKLGINAEM
jgi:hypothetical protein